MVCDSNGAAQNGRVQRSQQSQALPASLYPEGLHRQQLHARARRLASNASIVASVNKSTGRKISDAITRTARVGDVRGDT